jgi:hypothetical protein
LPYVGLFVDSSLGDAPICSSKFDRFRIGWFGRTSSKWDSSFSIQAW